MTLSNRDFGRPITADTRAYGGFFRRLVWRVRRAVERRLFFSRADVETYRLRSGTHIRVDDALRDRYIQLYSAESFWLHFVWEPLARLLSIPFDDSKYYEPYPGDLVVAEFLDLHPHLAHSSSGGGAFGVYMEWYSLDPAPWSGQREDWLLRIIDPLFDDDAVILIDGPMNALQAQVEFMTFDAEVHAWRDHLMEDAYPDGRYVDPGWAGYYEGEILDVPFGSPLAVASAAGLQAREVDDTLLFDEPHSADRYHVDDDPYLDDYPELY